MTADTDTAEPLAVVQRLREAINAHDPDAMQRCFAEDFRGELPCFPDASFVGNQGVRKNWERLFQALPDMRAEILRWTVSAPDEIWSEWEMGGTEPDGTARLMRGAIIIWVAGGQIAANRFYIHPVLSGPPNPLGD